MEKEIINKLGNRVNYKGFELQVLGRTGNVVMCYKWHQDDPIEFVVGLIHKIIVDVPFKRKEITEQFTEFGLNSERILFEYEDRKTALKQFRKLVKKHG